MTLHPEDQINLNHARNGWKKAERSEMTFFLDIIETLVTRGECGFSDTEMAVSTLYKIRKLVVYSEDLPHELD